MKALAECKLYTFVDSAYLNGRDPGEVARQLCEGGSDIIQLRAKDWDLVQIRHVAEMLLPITEEFGVGLVINDHPDIARRVGAPLCHLGQEDFFDRGHTSIKEIEPNGTLKIGLSTHSPDQAAKSLLAGADYIAIGPVFPTGTKPSARAVTLDYVRWAADNAGQRPWFAIGGINLTNLDEVLAAGAKRICVVSAILNSDSIVEACRAFRRKLERA